MADEPLAACPRCGAPIARLFSRHLIVFTEPLSREQTFAAHTEEEADRLGLEGGFAEDKIWE